jgi:hypothetical protein
VENALFSGLQEENENLIVFSHLSHMTPMEQAYM